MRNKCVSIFFLKVSRLLDIKSEEFLKYICISDVGSTYLRGFSMSLRYFTPPLPESLTVN